MSRRSVRRRSVRRRALPALVAGLSLVGAVLPALPAQAAPSATAPLVIDEVYGGGGNTGSTLLHDFVELVNKGTATISLDGLSVQYASASGTGAWAVTPLTGTLPAGRSFVVRQAAGTTNTAATPVAGDATATIAMAAGAGRVALVQGTTALSCAVAVGACSGRADVLDFVGYGATAGDYLATRAPVPGANTSITRRADHGNTLDNGADFVALTPPGPQACGTACTETAPPPPPANPSMVTVAQIQGSGAATGRNGESVTTQGVVTGVYRTGGLRGFFLQTAGTGGAVDPASRTASDGVFVLVSAGVPDVVVRGAFLAVSGTVGELSGQTQLTALPAGIVDVGPAPAPVTASTAPWPRTDEERERLEGMLYRPAGAFTVTNTFATNQFGEVGLAAGSTPLLQPTEVARPGTPQAAAVVADNAARSVLLDDGASTSFQARRAGALVNGALTPPYLVGTPARVAAPATLTSDVVLGFGFGAWRLQPLAPVDGAVPSTWPASFGATRTDAPDETKLGAADVKAASFNVLNYFTTLAEGRAGCTPQFPDRSGSPNTASCSDVRGAHDAADLARQQSKEVRASNSLGADVVGLVELENSQKLGEAVDEAVATLVAALNADAGAGTWAFVPSSAELPGPQDRDVITNAVIYKPAVLTPVGASRALGTQSGPGQAFDNAREPVGQVFRTGADGDPFLFTVNHFKSKSGSSTGDNADTGQGSFNGDRTRQAAALRDWIPTVLADTGTKAALVTGDLNAYGQEDPLVLLADAGYTSAEKRFAPGEYSYSFSGLSGSLDHVLVNDAALARTTGADVWNINSGESPAFEYSRFNYHGTDFHSASPFRSSDHDPVVVGLRARAPLVTTTTAVTSSAPVSSLGAPVTFTAVVAGPVTGGTVQFDVDGALLGAPVTVVDGRATSPSTAMLSAGPHTVTAVYGGDGGTTGSSGTLGQQVQYVVRLLSPTDASTVRPHREQGIAFQLTDVRGAPIPDAEAQAVVGAACRIAVSVSGASTLAAQCPVYKPNQDRFQVAWRTGKSTGTAVVRLVLHYPGASDQVVTSTVGIGK